MSFSRRLAREQKRREERYARLCDYTYRHPPPAIAHIAQFEREVVGLRKQYERLRDKRERDKKMFGEMPESDSIENSVSRLHDLACFHTEDGLSAEERAYRFGQWLLEKFEEPSE
jgi:hypothetical protein